MTPAEVYTRLLADNDGNAFDALRQASAALCVLGAGASCGFLRAAPVRSVRPLKPEPEVLDIPDASEAVGD